MRGLLYSTAMLLISLLVFSVGWVGVAGGMTTGGVMGLSFGWGLVSTVVFSLFSDDVFWGSSAGLLSAVGKLVDGETRRRRMQKAQAFGEVRQFQTTQ